MATTQKRKSNKFIYWLLAILGGLFLIVIIGKSQGWIGKPQELEVELAKVKRTTIVEKVSASGTVQPVIEVKIAPEVSGEIRELLIEEGDSVGKNQMLVKIRPDTWLSQLDRAEASLNQQKANVVSAEAALSRSEASLTRAMQEYKRQESLHDQKVISEADWQLAQQNKSIAENDYKSAKQSLEASKYIVRSSEATVREARENVRLTSVAAPMHGIVSKLSVKKGERVLGTAQMQGTEMLRIADLSKMEVRVNVNENDIVRVHLNDTTLIDVDAYANDGKQFKGIVTNIANTAKDKTSADAITEFEVRILILNSSYKDLVAKGNRYPFRPGMTASVEILTNRKTNVMSVPLSAVTTRNPDDENKPEGGQNGPQNNNNQQNNNGQQKPVEKKKDKVVVFVNEGGKAKMIEVKTGISDYDNIEILSGLSDSSQVVTGPFLVVSKRLKDGERIQGEADKDKKKEEKPAAEKKD
ncbi:MAG TPA: efflux RND transporter periplasmic adaptor subunit [Cyclobacteriaceae bacterium]|nr:efflux RND transporter periplasmic adaptor subunit [Cyclobacteriaceae bacterium]HMV10356.1 efflux RND transporter periplasmic adaptor subunit [Cyclobacteriaceae bacterium]HMV89289.1 efflux RND transporter periplasmic adaptor subunit [Cyclobacteriaceae bacterium]HMX00381.1 efflux RND transporter periplasmic adaptor subunit [Cyclobacteriaceae bacterium]HMX49620.1 efflux RND transporter periplasmic adaptor subunit [Cyclobacteriaceae bacterium]